MAPPIVDKIVAARTRNVKRIVLREKMHGLRCHVAQDTFMLLCGGHGLHGGPAECTKNQKEVPHSYLNPSNDRLAYRQKNNVRR